MMAPIVDAQQKRGAAAALTAQLAGPSFEAVIRGILTSSVSQPILQLDRSAEPSDKEALRMLMNATHLLREQYFPKLDRAGQAIEKRAKLLHLLRDKQRQELAQLMADKESVQRNAERLAERYEDIVEKQTTLFRRAQEVVHLAIVNNPHAAAQELEYQQKIEKIAAATQRLAASLAVARNKIGSQENQMNRANVGSGGKVTPAKTIELNPRKEKVVLELLNDL